MVIAVKIINENIDKPVAIKLSLVIIVCIDSTIKYINIGNDDTNVALFLLLFPRKLFFFQILASLVKISGQKLIIIITITYCSFLKVMSLLLHYSNTVNTVIKITRKLT